MNSRLRTSASLLALAIGLGGCSSNSILQGDTIDYRSARQVSPLEIPPDLTGPTRDDRFAVPDVSPRGVATYSAYESDRASRPTVGTTTEVLMPVDNMRIERAGTQRWLVVSGNPDALWPDIKDFWQELGFIINIDRPEIGVMETDWAEDRARIPQDFIRSMLGRVLDGLFSTAERDKFRTRLEEGREPGTVEIFISHRGMIEVFTSTREDQTVWQPRPADPELEVEMLRRLMVRLGAEEERAATVLATADVAQRASLEVGEGRNRLVLDESFDRAWRRVGLALDRIGFTVEDRDRSQGLFYVRYIDPDADARSQRSEGMLSRLAFWRGSETGEGVSGGSEYRIRVGSSAGGSQVSVLSREGGEDTSSTARRMLELLHEQLR